MRQLKALADPEGLLNPGVILNANPARAPRRPEAAALGGRRSRQVHRVRLLRAEVPHPRDHARPPGSGSWCAARWPACATPAREATGLARRSPPTWRLDGRGLVRSRRAVRDGLSQCRSTRDSWSSGCGGRAHSATGERLESPRIADRFGDGRGRRADGAARRTPRPAGARGRGRWPAITRSARPAAREPVAQWTPEMPRAAAGTELPRTSPARRRGDLLSHLPLAHDGRAARASPTSSRCPMRWSAWPERAGDPSRIPHDVAGTCCGVPFSSKGYTDAGTVHAVNAGDRPLLALVRRRAASPSSSTRARAPTACARAARHCVAEHQGPLRPAAGSWTWWSSSTKSCRTCESPGRAWGLRTASRLLGHEDGARARAGARGGGVCGERDDATRCRLLRDGRRPRADVPGGGRVRDDARSGGRARQRMHDGLLEQSHVRAEPHARHRHHVPVNRVPRGRGDEGEFIQRDDEQVRAFEGFPALLARSQPA